MNTLKQNTPSSDIVLVLANTRWFGRRPWVIMPLTIAILTSILKEAGIGFTLVDANLNNYDEETLAGELAQLNPKIVLVSSSSIEYYQCCDTTVQIAKKVCPGAKPFLAVFIPQYCLKKH